MNKRKICQMCSADTTPLHVESFYGWNKELSEPVDIYLCTRCKQHWTSEVNGFDSPIIYLPDPYSDILEYG
jgi:hypothetical protein